MAAVETPETLVITYYTKQFHITFNILTAYNYLVGYDAV
jgi:hypothetical protein